jgi:hypothetical protein
MKYEYVVSKDFETDEIEYVGRFGENCLTEIWKDGKWVKANDLYGELLDGLLDEITEAEAMKIIGQKKPQLEAA